MSSQPARDVPDVNQELPNRSLFGSGLGVAFECDTALSCVAETDVHCIPQLDKRADVPFSRADVNKALFEARLQNWVILNGSIYGNLV